MPMSISVTATATASGVPIFCRQRGGNENLQFSTTASLHGVDVYSQCRDVQLLTTKVDDGNIIWEQQCKSISLVGTAVGGLQCNLQFLLSCVHDAMVFCIGSKELQSLKNVEQVKRDLRRIYPIIDSFLESLDPNCTSNLRPTLLLDLVECILCPQAQQLQQALNHYAESVEGHWACLCIHGNLVATSSDWCELDPREAKLLLLLTVAQDGAPLRDTPVYLPYTSPNVAFRAVTCKLLADVYVLVICGATPSLSEIDEIVLQCWESHAQIIKEAKLTFPRNFPISIGFESCVLGVLAINVNNCKCAVARSLQTKNQGPMSGAHRLDILRTFYVKEAHHLAPEFRHADREDYSDSYLEGMYESYWCSDYHKCHARRIGNILLCVLYTSSLQTHAMRYYTETMIKQIANNKEVYW